MNQSGFIVGALLAGFVLFIAARSRLPTYAAVLWGPAPASPGTSGASGGGSSNLGIPGIGGILDEFGRSLPGGHPAEPSNPAGAIAGIAKVFSTFATLFAL